MAWAAEPGHEDQAAALVLGGLGIVRVEGQRLLAIRHAGLGDPAQQVAAGIGMLVAGGDEGSCPARLFVDAPARLALLAPGLHLVLVLVPGAHPPQRRRCLELLVNEGRVVARKNLVDDAGRGLDEVDALEGEGGADPEITFPEDPLPLHALLEKVLVAAGAEELVHVVVADHGQDGEVGA
jgi:hypothetical protein